MQITIPQNKWSELFEILEFDDLPESNPHQVFQKLNLIYEVLKFNPETYEWLIANCHSWRLEYKADDFIYGINVGVLYIDFKEKDHAMLFKMTWL